MGILEEINNKLDQLLAASEGEAEATPPKTEEKKATPKKRTRTRSKKKTGPTLDDVKAEAKLALATEGGREKLIATLEEYGAAKVVELGEDQFEGFIADCKAIAEGGEAEDDDFEI